MGFRAVPLRPPNGAGQRLCIRLVAADLAKGASGECVNFVEG